MSTVSHEIRGWRGAPWFTLATAVLATLATLMPNALEFDRSSIASGQLWRIVTCHAAHYPGEHFAWCIIAFVLLGAICEFLDRASFLLVNSLSMLLIPIALLFAQPEMTAYRGLSGIASALFVLLLVHVIAMRSAEGEWISVASAGALGVAFVMKIFLEMYFGVTIFVGNVAREFVPVPLAHLVGSAIGLTCGGGQLLRAAIRCRNDCCANAGGRHRHHSARSDSQAL